VQSAPCPDPAPTGGACSHCGRHLGAGPRDFAVHVASCHRQRTSTLPVQQSLQRKPSSGTDSGLPSDADQGAGGEGTGRPDAAWTARDPRQQAAVRIAAVFKQRVLPGTMTEVRILRQPATCTADPRKLRAPALTWCPR